MAQARTTVSPTRPTGRNGQADAIEALSRSGPSALGCGLLLATQAVELCGDRRIRIEFPPFPTIRSREDPPEHRPSMNLSTEAADVLELPVGSPGGSGRVEALLQVENGSALPPPRLDDLALLVRQAGLVLERHRLAREVGRIRWEAAEDRTNLAHSLRGPLNSALLRVDALLYGDPEATLGGDWVVKDLRGLRESVLAMAERIQGTLDVPDAGRRRPSPASGSLEPARVSDLLRAAWAAVAPGAGEDLSLDVDAGVGPVASGQGRLQAGLEELLGMVRASRGTPAITVTTHPPGAVRVTVSLELPSEAPPPELGPVERERKPVPSLPDVVAELGGRTWIDAGPDGRGAVTLVLRAIGCDGAGREGM